MKLPGLGRLRWTDYLNVGAALVVAGLGVAETWVPLESRNYDGDPVLTTVTVAVLATALLLRRLAPVGVLAAAGVIWVGLHAFGRIYLLFYGQWLPVLIMMYAAVRWGRRYAPAVAGALVIGVEVFLTAIEPDMQNLNEAAFQFGVVTLVWLAAFGLRVQAYRVQRSVARAIEVEVAAAEQAMAAVTEERTRIARELHDIVGHAVSVMVVQAGAAEQVVDDDPEQVRRALRAIRGTGSGAMTEMRRLVGMLREDGAAGALHPQPGVALVPELVADARATGLDVDYSSSGEARELSAGVDLTAYRVVQEALTNVRRHARAATVRVVLDYGPDDLAIEVRDDGVGVSASGAREQGAAGHGLAGMRERVALYGGRVETDGENGFTVRAVLPTAAG